MRFSDEPAVWIGFLQMVITAAVAFGLNFTEEQIGAIILVLQAAATLFVRSQVTPVGKLKG